MKKLIVLALTFALLLGCVAGTATAAKKLVYGDVNGDGAIDAADALLVLQVAVFLEFLDDDGSDTADVSGDVFTTGDWVIDAFDALLILQFAVEKLEVFPVVKLKAEALLPPKDTLPITALQQGKSYTGIVTKQFSFTPMQMNHNIVQGTCFVNGEFYVAMSNQTGSEELICIQVYSQTGEFLRKSPALDLNHANNLSYNPTLDRLVVSHCQGTQHSDFYTYSLVDPNTFEITKTEVKDFPFFSMAYSPEKQQYASGRWSGETIDICDKDMNLIKTVNVTVPKSLSQGVFADGNYIYFIRSTKDSQGSELLIYNWDATLIHQIPIQGMQDHTYEPENINIINGTAYIMCNQPGFPGGHCFILTFKEA